MRKKLLFLGLLIIIAILILTNERKKIVFVKNESEIKLYTDKDIERVDNLIVDLYEDKTKAPISGIEPKYATVKKENTLYCNKDNTYVVSQEKGYNVISQEEGNNYSYYKEKYGSCELIGKIENVNFTEKVSATYANNSIYTNFESLSDIEVSGMVRVTKDEIIPFDSLYTRYTNPIAFSNGVIMIKNNRSIVAFDKEDKEIFKQNNDSKDRRVIAINKIGKSFFMVVKVNKKYVLEGYDINNIENIEKSKPNLSYDVTDFFKKLSFETSELTTKQGQYFGGFTLDESTLIVSADFSKVFYLDNADTTLDINNGIAYLKKEELYYVVNLHNRKREHIGNIKALNFKLSGSDIFFTVLDNAGKEQYIKFSIR
ncbi:hypothetical protein OKW22_001156 [Bacilli bacterium PM5-3]|nr:hypothetical protein [Bacilli bacterium PM5-3]MDH6604124.1 hypothetical protein [Bacilli bacterium PM5-9]